MQKQRYYFKCCNKSRISFKSLQKSSTNVKQVTRTFRTHSACAAGRSWM